MDRRERRCKNQVVLRQLVTNITTSFHITRGTLKLELDFTVPQQYCVQNKNDSVKNNGDSNKINT